MYDYDHYVKTSLQEFRRYSAKQKLVKAALAGAKSRRKPSRLLALSRPVIAFLVSLR